MSHNRDCVAYGRNFSITLIANHVNYIVDTMQQFVTMVLERVYAND